MKMNIKKIAIVAIFISLTLIMSYVDSLIAIPIPVPGIKLGIANIVIIYVLYKLGTKEAILISILKVILSSILFGNLVSLIYSIAGSILSLSLMIILKKCTLFSIITVSVVGAIMHNFGQILMAVILMATKEIIYYLPILIITGTISGICIGILSAIVLKYTKLLYI